MSDNKNAPGPVLSEEDRARLRMFTASEDFGSMLESAVETIVDSHVAAERERREQAESVAAASRNGSKHWRLVARDANRERDEARAEAADLRNQQPFRVADEWRAKYGALAAEVAACPHGSNSRCDCYDDLIEKADRGQRLAAGVAALAEEYEISAARESHGGELWSSTAAALRALPSVGVETDRALGDHPYIDPGDGRQECYLCGKFVHDVTHSCKGVPVTKAAEARVRGLIDAVRDDERSKTLASAALGAVKDGER